MEEISNMYQKQHKEDIIHRAVTTAVFIVLHTLVVCKGSCGVYL